MGEVVDTVRMNDADLLRELMFVALERTDLTDKLSRNQTRLTELQNERCVRLLVSTNDDQEGYDRASALAALDAMQEDGMTITAVLHRLTPDFDEGAWRRGDLRVVREI